MAAVTAHPSRLRVGRPDYVILTVVGALVVLGLLAVYSSSFALGLLEFGDADYFVFRQAMFAVMGAVALLVFMKSDYRYLRVVSPLLMLGAIVALVAVLAPFTGMERNGAHRWIAIDGPIPPLQPSEFAKLALVVYVAAWLAARGDGVKSLWTGFVPVIFLVGVVAGLVMMEPDLGTTVILVLTALTMVFIAGASLKHVAAFSGIAGVAGGVLVLSGEYRADRIFAFVAAEDDPSGRGFQTLQLLIALGSGGIHGLGLGASRQKFFYVPGAHTDGIFAIIGEELGLIGSALVLALFAVLMIRGFRVIVRARDNFGALLAAGIVSWIGYQTIINLGGITRSIPLTGVPLPFLSYGGSALMAMLAAIGMLLSVSRYGVDAKSLAKKPTPIDGSDKVAKPRRATSGRKAQARKDQWPQRKGAR